MPGNPNILVVIVDDMGVHQLGCYGGTYFETPRLDALARAGARFDSAYSASPVCSPARAALYTGVHPARLHLTNYIPGTAPANPRLLTPAWRAHLPVEAVTLGDAFRAKGYATAHFGKWHLAPDYHYEPGRAMDPESQGFDRVIVTRKPKETADPNSDPHHITQLTDAALRFMGEERSQPFLCVVAHNAVHRPEIGRPELVAKYARKPGTNLRGANRPAIAAMVEELDASVGRLLDGLQAAGRAQDTIVVFTSDHGSFDPTDERKPLRGSKADLYESGIRVPLIMHWPGQIAAQVRGGPVFGTDLLPTLLELAKLPPATGIDGSSLAASLRAPERPLPDRREFCWHFPHYHHLGVGPSGAIRRGRYKLIEWFEGSLGVADVTPYELFDLERDPGEAHNLAEERPRERDELVQRLAQWRRSIGAQEMLPNPRFDPANLAAALPAPPPGDPANPFRT